MKLETVRVTKTAPANPRRHDLDALRAAAMLLGLVYHAALSFALGLGWMVQDVSQSKGLFVFQAFVHGFRMQLFMLVSGFFTAMLWRRQGLKSLLWHRFRRVLLPCLVGLVTVVPAMNWAVSTGMGISASKRRALESADTAPRDLWGAIKQGDLAAVEARLAEGVDLAAQHPQFGTTPLTWAALAGPPSVVRALLEKGADVNGRNRDGGTALHAAAFLGRAEIVDLLIQKGADINARSTNGETPLVSAGVDYGVVQWIAGLLAIEVNQERVSAGRGTVVEKLKSMGAERAGGAVAAGSGGSGGSHFRRVLDGLINTPVFVLVWFLWFLWWLVIAFAGYALVANSLGWRARQSGWVLSPASLLWLVPLTMVPTWFMSSGNGEFGPDTAMGILPAPHVFAYYAIFFFFGALYFDSADDAGRLGRSWRWMLPVTLLVVFPIALELATGTFGMRDAMVPERFQRPATVLFQALYAWLMAFGCMGMFRSLLTKESAAIRYLSDSSYWLYLAHLPLTIVLQAWISDWRLPSYVKLGWLFLVVAGVLLAVYQTLIRYSWVGTFLNGVRTRPGKAAGGRRENDRDPGEPSHGMIPRL